MFVASEREMCGCVVVANLAPSVEQTCYYESSYGTYGGANTVGERPSANARVRTPRANSLEKGDGANAVSASIGVRTLRANAHEKGGGASERP